MYALRNALCDETKNKGSFVLSYISIARMDSMMIDQQVFTCIQGGGGTTGFVYHRHCVSAPSQIIIWNCCCITTNCLE